MSFSKSQAFAKLLEAARAKKAAAETVKVFPDGVVITEKVNNNFEEWQSIREEEVEEPVEEIEKKHVGSKITLNTKQQEACDAIVNGDDIVLIGAAGTGKTSTQREVTEQLISSRRLPNLSQGTKYLHTGKPGAAIVSYTRKAVNNIRYAVVDELKAHTLTLHKLLEFGPEFYDIEDPETGELKHSMRFVPARNRFNPLPPDLKLIIFEEASMISVELYEQLQEAMPHDHQEVFIGDIQQLPPIFGMAILGFKLNTLPVVELTEIYRQALESPIISLAWALLQGNKKVFSPLIKRFNLTDENGMELLDDKGKKISRITVPALDQFSRSSYNEHGEHKGTVKIQIWQRKLSEDLALLTTIKQFCAWIEDGYYKEKEDIILCPFNKGFGTIELNKGIHNYLGKRRGAAVNEIIAGFQTHYLAVGDRVLYDKEDAIITSIRTNSNYLGKKPQPASVNLDRNGHRTEEMTEAEKVVALETEVLTMDEVESLMSLSLDDVSERVQAASHVIGVTFTHPEADDKEIVLDSASEINNLLGGHAITVHKFQGSQAKKVFLVLHQRHSVMTQRELMYTAVTRAEEWLHVICESDSFEKAIKSQRIKGDTIKEKAEFFKGKATKDELVKTQRELDFLANRKPAVTVEKPVLENSSSGLRNSETVNEIRNEVSNPSSVVVDTSVTSRNNLLAKLAALRGKGK